MAKMNSPGIQDNYSLLLGKLREFKRKFYKNEIVRGGFYFSAVLLVSYLLVAVLEYFGRFDTTMRTVLFYGFVSANAFIFLRYILMPALSLLEMRKGLSYEQAASIIGRHFGEVQDKLLNTLQLHEQAQNQEEATHRDLIEASIRQKTLELKPVPFVRAVDYRRNRKYMKYTLVPLGVLAGIFVFAPAILRESTTRLMAYDKYFEKEAPFEFVLINKNLQAIRQEDYAVEVKIKGQELPADVFLMVDDVPYKMNGKSKTDFLYTLKNLQKEEISLRFNANGFSSREYTLKVLPRAVLQKFEVVLDYPAYVGKGQETLHNTGDLTIPAGTRVTWKFHTENTDEVNLSFEGKNRNAERKGSDLYVFESRFTNDQTYYLRTGNKFLRNSDSIQYQISVLPDAFPSIMVNQEQDSVRLKNLFFSGEIADDYGFSKLVFRYRFNKTGDSSKVGTKEFSQTLALAAGRNMQPFHHFWDLNNLKVGPGDELEYYFEVWDNDGVQGAKSARTQKFFFKAPSLREIDKTTEANNAELQKNMQAAMQQAMELQREMDKVRRSLMDKRSLDWQDKKRIQDMLQKQQQLEQKMDDLKQKYDDNLRKEQEFKQIDPETLEKHRKLQEIMNEAMTPELKKIMEDLQKILEEANKDQIQKELDKMKFQDKEVQKELDRMMELFKQLQFEQKLTETIDKLDKLVEKEEKLSQQTEEKAKDDKSSDKKDSKAQEEQEKKQQELQEKQKELKEEFEDVKKSLDELQQKNEELEKKNDLEQTDKEEQDIQQEMDNSEQNLQNKQNNKASQNQKSAADKMKKMNQKLKEMQMEMQQEAHMEDYNALRQILENLVYVSQEQERLMEDFRITNQYNPKYVELGQKQRKLKDDSKMIEDSLLALSKRVMEIQSFVNKEIGEINFNMENALSSLGERNTAKARSHQQFAMTSLNNLALMLSESLQQMQQNMQQQQQQQQCKGGNCKKPQKSGQSKANMQKLRQMQEQLAKDLEDMKKGMKKDGKQGQEGQNGEFNKKLAEMAARQEAIRRQLQKLNEEKNKSGSKPLGDLDKIQEQMDKGEEDLYRQNLDAIIKRQHDIMIRMLESEKAEKQQEMDEERKAEQAKDHKNPAPPLLEKYLKEKEKEVELLRTVPPSLNPYYRQRVKDYFQGARAE